MTYSLTLRESVGRKLSIEEMDNNLLYLQNISGGSGSQGFQGPQGNNGSDGNQGPQGFQGPQGNDGNQGPQGFQGPQGVATGSSIPSGSHYQVLILDGSGNPSFSSALFDASGLTSSDWNNRVLCNNTLGNPTLNWDLMRLNGYSGQTMMAWGSGILYTGGGAFSADWSSKFLYGAGSTVVANWSTQNLFDSVGTQSIDWNTKLLYDGSTGHASIDWANRHLLDRSGSQILSWNSTNSFTIVTPNVSISAVPYIFPFSQGGAGYFLSNDGSGHLSWSANKIPYVINNISNGDTVQLRYNARNIIDSGTDIANMTFFFNTVPSAGDFVEIKMIHALTVGPSWSLNGTASMANIVPYVTLSAGQEFSFTYDSATNKWY